MKILSEGPVQSRVTPYILLGGGVGVLTGSVGLAVTALLGYEGIRYMNRR